MRILAIAAFAAISVTACSPPPERQDAGPADTVIVDGSDAADSVTRDAPPVDATVMDAAEDAALTDARDDASSLDAVDTMAQDATDATVVDAIEAAVDSGARDAVSVFDSAPPTDAPTDAPTDVSRCDAAPEDCFDDRDNDCDGLVDCADPDCVPVAECVPDPGTGAMAGTIVAAGATCPSAFDAHTLALSRGLNAPATCSGCACTGAVGCSTVINLLSASCGRPAVNSIGASTLSCNFLAGIGTSGGLEVDPFTTLAYCNASGRPTLAPLAWSEQQTFCATDSRGGGCTAGMACVPKLPGSAHHCVTAADASSCASGYTAQAGGAWYTGVSDTRSCGATCSCTPMGPASCGTSYVALYGASGTCSTPIGSITPGTTTCAIPAGTARAQVQLQGTTTPSCTPNTAATGSATPTGATTVCCD